MIVEAAEPGAGRRRRARRRTPRFLLVAEYQATLFRHFWRGSIVTIFVSPVLYLLAMGLGVGTLVDANAGNALDDTPYFDYVAPGLLAAAAMQTAVNGSMYPVLASVKWLRTAYAVVATPVRPIDLALGTQTWLAAQLVLAASVFAALITLAGAVRSPLVVAVPFCAAIGGLAYSAPMAAWSIGRADEHSFQMILRLMILPSFLLSGTFFPVDQLPAPLEALAMASPLSHTVELARGLSAGTASPGPVAGHLAVLIGYTSAGLLLARREYQRRLHQ